MTTHAELVEKVARAMWDAIPSDPDIEQGKMSYEELCAEYPCVMDDHLHQARAALATIAEALRVPSDAMTMAGGKAMIPESVNNTADAYWNANACWRAMLAASPLVQPKPAQEPEPCPKPCERARFNPVNACEECPWVREDEEQ